MKKWGREEAGREKILDVDATMQGTLVFRDAVNLRINGSFEGSLDTKGTLTISENATVRASIRGENITIAGRVYGDIVAARQLKIVAPARITGNITAPMLSVSEGAMLDGECHMSDAAKNYTQPAKRLMSAEELAKYLEVETSLVFEWVNSGRLPGIKDKDAWKFDQSIIDEWVASGKVK